MEAWRQVWRDGMAQHLPTRGLWWLRQLLLTDDPRLIQGATTRPPPMQHVHDWELEAADAVVACHWCGDGGVSVAQGEQFFARVAHATDECLGDVAVFRHFLNWYDDTPRPTMRRELLAEVNRVLCGRVGSPLSLDAPADVLADWLIENGLEMAHG